MATPFDLTDRTFLVTGASSGIGRACAQLIAELGGTLVLTGRRADALEETRRSLAGNRPHRLLAGDLSSESFIAQLVREAGPLDGLVHAAGVCPAVPIAVAETADIEATLRLNYTSFLQLMKFYARRSQAKDGFSAVAIASVSASVGWPGGALYAGSKCALCAAVRSLAVELAPRLRVNAVCPGNVRTPLFESLTEDLADDETVRRLEARQVLGIGEPRQIAGPVCFLLSAAASFVTGACLPVDGGYLAQ